MGKSPEETERNEPSGSGPAATRTAPEGGSAPEGAEKRPGGGEEPVSRAGSTRVKEDGPEAAERPDTASGGKPEAENVTSWRLEVPESIRGGSGEPAEHEADEADEGGGPEEPSGGDEGVTSWRIDVPESVKSGSGGDGSDEGGGPGEEPERPADPRQPAGEAGGKKDGPAKRAEETATSWRLPVPEPAGERAEPAKASAAKESGKPEKSEKHEKSDGPRVDPRAAAASAAERLEAGSKDEPAGKAEEQPAPAAPRKAPLKMPSGGDYEAPPAPAAPPAPPNPPANPPAPAAGPPAAAAQPSHPAQAPQQPSGPPPAPPEQSGPEFTAQLVPPPLPPEPELTNGQGFERPKDPLSLLAQLTNTPPKPETPLRRSLRRTKIWASLVVLVLLVFVVVQQVRPVDEPSVDLTASSVHTFPGKPAAGTLPWPKEGQAAVSVDGIGSMGTSGEQKPVPIGSTAKVMTAYLILRDHPLKLGTQGPKITVDQKAQDQVNKGTMGESTIKVTKGEQLSERQALEAVLIPSANNVARLLARWDTGNGDPTKGSEAAFVKKMQAAAKQLGMTGSTFTDPSGLQATTVSTAGDLAKLGLAAMQDPVFRTVVNMLSVELPENGRVSNYNTLVGQDGVTGIKTGSTTKAGGNLLFSSRKTVNGHRELVVGAVLGQFGTPILQSAIDASKPLNLAAQNQLKSQVIIKKGQVVGQVDNGTGGMTPVVATKDVTAVGWDGAKAKLAIEQSAKIARTAPAGTAVGKITVGSGMNRIQVPVALQKPLEKPSFFDKLFHF